MNSYSNLFWFKTSILQIACLQLVISLTVLLKNKIIIRIDKTSLGGYKAYLDMTNDTSIQALLD